MIELDSLAALRTEMLPSRMAIEGVLRTGYAAYVEVPRELERNVYKWSEYARGDESDTTRLTLNLMIELFPKSKIVGLFRGFSEGGLEFHADLVLPYRTEFQNIPMHGQFVLVQLESPSEAVLGRITSLSSEGRLTGAAGEQFNMSTT